MYLCVHICECVLHVCECVLHGCVGGIRMILGRRGGGPDMLSNVNRQQLWHIQA